MRIDLIDYLAFVMQCEISDLRYVSCLRLVNHILKIEPEECTLKEWEDCVDYLLGEKRAFRSCKEAKKYMVEQLENDFKNCRAVGER